MRMLSCSKAPLWDLINSGELESYLEGGARKILVSSIHAYVQRKVDAARKAA